MRKTLLLMTLTLVACQAPLSAPAAPVAAGSSSHGERQIATAYPMPIVADDGLALGRVERLTIDDHGRIIGATPAESGLEPADAPQQLRSPIS